MKLKEILLHKFIIPLSITLLLSTILAIVLSISFTESFYNESLQKKVTHMEKRKIHPIISTANQLFSQRIQRVITSLNIIKDYLINDSAYNEDEAFNYENYLLSALHVTKHYSDIIQTKTQKTFYDQGTWFINKKEKIPTKIEDPTNLNQLIIKYMNRVSRLIPIMRALYELHKEKKEHSIELFYIANRKTELFISYPILTDRNDFYPLFEKDPNQPVFCRDKENKKPEYYYFPCRDWFLQLSQMIIDEESYKQTNPFYFISHPYKYITNDSQQIGLTICLAFKDLIIDKDNIKISFSQKLDNYIEICADIWYSTIIRTFDNFNRRMHGYFIIVRINSEYPVYHPGILQDNYYNDITRIEYSIYGRHYIYQVSYFKEKIVPLMTAQYSKDDIYTFDKNTLGFSLFDPSKPFPNSVKGFTQTSYEKEEAIFKFSIFPIFLQVLVDNKKYEEKHLFSLIYIINSTAFDIYTGEYATNVKYISILYGLLVFVIGGVFLSFVTKLIFICGKNITHSIKNITSRIKRDISPQVLSAQNESNTNNNSAINNSLNQTTSSLAKLNKVNQTNNYAPVVNPNNQNNEEINLLTGIEDEESIILTKNKELTNRFDFILELKEVLLFLRNPKPILDPNQITKYLSSNKVFGKMEYTQGKELCLSNIGNICSYCGKYDKAITFLSNSLGLKPNELDDFNQNNFEASLQEYLSKENFKTTTTVHNHELVNNIPNKINNSIEITRYMKLFDTYKMFFSSIKKKQHFLDYISFLTKTHNDPLYQSIKETLLYDSDYYVDREHHFESFRIYIKNCIKKLISSRNTIKKNEQICYCLLELLHLEINYLKIKVNRQINQTMEINSLDKNKEEDNEEQNIKAEKKNKEKEMNDDIKEKFNVSNKLVKKIAILLERLQKKFNKNIQDNYRDYLYNIKQTNNISCNIKLNYVLLLQKFNYLNAKLLKFTEDYSNAITYYLKVTDNKHLIIDAILYNKSNQKIIEILSKAKEHNEFHRFKKFQPEELIKICQKNISSLGFEPKDFVIALDTSPSESSYSKLQNKQIKIIKSIFDKYISSKDQFCLYTFSEQENLTKVMPLTYKTRENYPFILLTLSYLYNCNNSDNSNGLFDNNDDNKNKEDNCELIDNEELIDEDKDIYPGMKMKIAIDAIFNVACELPEIKLTQRNQYIVCFTECFQSEKNEKITKENIVDLFKDKNRRNDKVKLIIIGSLMGEQDKLNIAKEIFTNYFESCDYFEYENYQELKKLIMVTGQFPRGYEYPNEIFDK